ncbi:SNF2 family N-terminal domain-domain-containing protein [Syncephalastrum racemosum]|uniref:DNA helicase n=1 Tax=Syncephalastrum racemosum TaxID=13706 RepID=A0A1X2H8W6_SYNRA|nr:SNF2 family N-terminal domain-domain-containing protein [Syncephalastrum racemosum]
MEGYLVEQPAIISPDITLKNYQMIGINWLLMLYRKKISGILADEMGLGKTAQVISFLGRLYELGIKGPHLIIVPTSTMDNWLREFERFCPTLEIIGYHGTQSERFEMREDMLADDAEEFNVVVTTYNIATGQKEDRSFLRKLKCESVILDEGHMIRNCTSARYKHLMSLSAPFRLLLTGTPLQNNLQELISLLMFIMPDMLVAHEEDIRNLFKIKTISGDTSGKASQIQILSRQRVARAKKMMTPFVLRRRKVDVLKDLPKKVQVIDRNPMLPEQQKLYDLILRESKQSYEQAMQDKSKKQKGTGARLDRLKNIVIQLRKAADHPLLFRHIYDDATIRKMSKAIMKEERYWDAEEEYIFEDMSVMTDFELNNLCKEHKSISKFQFKDEEWMKAGKVERLKEILPAMKQKGNKVLLFSQFTSLLDILQPVMDTLDMRYLRLDGSTSMADRQVLIDQFNEDKDINVFLLSTKAGGFGINLTSANIVILYDMDFNPQNDRQAEDRAHRVGQTRDVTVIKLVAKDSIEEQILKMADIKLRLDKSVSGIEDDPNTVDEAKEAGKMQSLLKSVLLS